MDYSSYCEWDSRVDEKRDFSHALHGRLRILRSGKGFAMETLVPTDAGSVGASTLATPHGATGKG